jgi:hypothetical protein
LMPLDHGGEKGNATIESSISVLASAFSGAKITYSPVAAIVVF